MRIQSMKKKVGCSTTRAGANFRVIAAMLFYVAAAGAQALELSSPDIAEGKPLNSTQVYKGFGCDGGDQSPALNWSGAPDGTKSFAVTVYDPDAPTGSGWWHWVVYDIPASTKNLAAGVGKVDMPVTIGKQARNDFGTYEFGGACPPAGDKPHHYIFTVYSLKTENLGVPKDASAALIGFMLHAQSLGKAAIAARFGR